MDKPFFEIMYAVYAVYALFSNNIYITKLYINIP